MEILSSDQLIAKKCEVCETGTDPYSVKHSQQQLDNLPGWELGDDQKNIFKTFTFSNFLQGLEFCNQVGAIAEEDQHHPDLHLTGYRNVRVEMTTHSIGGLSENDFILAAKIDSIEPS
ncbi:4a-hydroxytetrahydrobiopterin dehydratase [Mariniblastus sp.]|nr:4a-hydroxytetrahydrobiopterin dehydratase [Mariniblastus sp.]